MRQLDVYVPVKGSAAEHMIDAGSGIVGVLVPDPHGAGEDRVHVYYEGNRHGYANVVTFADRCELAAGRLWEAAPTIARAVLPAVELTKVGVFTEGHGVDMPDVRAMLALTRWVGAAPGTEILAHAELRLSRPRYIATGGGS